MPLSIFLIVLFAAALHAGWNAAVKISGDKTVAMLLVTSTAALLAALALPFLDQPLPASWSFIAASARAMRSTVSKRCEPSSRY